MTSERIGSDVRLGSRGIYTEGALSLRDITGGSFACIVHMSDNVNMFVINHIC